MARRTVDMEPAAAFAEMVTALAVAGRYAGHGMRTTGKRAARRARVVGAEAARRSALAALVLSGRLLPELRRPRKGLMVLVAAAGGAAAAVAARQSVIALRARVTRDSAPVGSPADEAAAGQAARKEREDREQ